MGCCSEPKEHFEYAKNPGPMEKRSCRDLFFLILFIIFWAGMLYVASNGLEKGNPARFIYGVDYEGNVCGTNNINFGVVPKDKAQNFVSKSFLYFLPGTQPGKFLDICVTACPSETHITPQSVDNILCPYNVTPSINETGLEGPCWGTFASTPLIHRCIPMVDNNITEKVSQEVIEVLNLQRAADLSVKILSDMIRVWQYIAISAAFAIVFSFIWLYLLRVFAGVIVWATIVGVIGIIGALAYLLQAHAHELEVAYLRIPIYLRLVSEQDTINLLKGLFIVLVIIDAVIILVILFMCKRIQIAIGVIKEASKAMIKIPSILLVPIFIALAIVPLAVYWLYIGAYLGTASTPMYDASGNFLGYEADDTLRKMQLYHLFGGFWTLNFLHAIGECTIAGSIASWYWVHDKQDVPSFPVLKSFWRVIRYHMGSLLFGSLILAFVQFIRFLLHQLEQRVKGQESTFTKFVFKCLKCLLDCFERFIKFLNKNAYIMISIYGYSFCEGARRGFELTAKNILRVSALSCVSTFLIFLGKLFVCMLTTLVFFFLLKNNTDVEEYVFPLMAICVLSYAIAVAFFAVFDMAVDTILLCFCEDNERNDGSSEKPYYMSDALKSHLDRNHTCCLCC